MSLTITQQQQLRTDITVTRSLTVYQGQTLLQWWNGGADGVLASFYNQIASPASPIWRPDLGVDELKDAIVWADYVALTPNGSLKQAAYLALTQGNVINATKQGIRDAFVSIFGNGSASLTAMTAIAMRNGTYLETLLASAAVQGAKVSEVYGLRIIDVDISNTRLA